MRVAYLLSQAPFARQEQFVLEEAAELIEQGVDVRLFPLRPGRRPLEGTPARIAARTHAGGAFAPRTLIEGAAALVRRPGLGTLAYRTLAGSRPDEPRRDPALRNTLVMPKTMSLVPALERFAPHHVHAHFAASTSTAAWVLGEALGVPWSFTAHSPTDIDKRNLITAKVEHASFTRTISAEGRRRLLAPMPAEYAQKVRVIPMGVRAAGRSTAPAAFARDDVRPALICVARLIRAKGVEHLIDALSVLRGRGLDVVCHVAGDGPERERLLQRAETRRVADLVRLHGYVPNPEILRALDAGCADIAVLPSYSEGVPVTLMEAMARDLPVVATSVGAVAELVRDGAGELVPPRDANALAAALERQIARLGTPSGGREIVARRYCLSRNCAELARLFEAHRASPSEAASTSGGPSEHA